MTFYEALGHLLEGKLVSAKHLNKSDFLFMTGKRLFLVEGGDDCEVWLSAWDGISIERLMSNYNDWVLYEPDKSAELYNDAD